MSYENLIDHDSYEILNVFPYSIRRKSDGSLINESIRSDGYSQVYIDSKPFYKHRLIALQFIPNPDPIRFKEVDHINRNKSDNRIENLRWVDRSANNKNRRKFTKREKEFLEELPENAIEIIEYEGFEFDRYWFDYDSEQVIVNSRNRFSIVLLSVSNSLAINLRDINGKQHSFGWIKFYNEMLERIE